MPTTGTGRRVIGKKRKRERVNVSKQQVQRGSVNTRRRKANPGKQCRTPKKSPGKKKRGKPETA